MLTTEPHNLKRLRVVRMVGFCFSLATHFALLAFQFATFYGPINFSSGVVAFTVQMARFYPPLFYVLPTFFRSASLAFQLLTLIGLLAIDNILFVALLTPTTFAVTLALTRIKVV